MVHQIELDAKGGDRAGVAPTPVSLPVFPNRHVVKTFEEFPNPLPHARKTREKDSPIDPAVGGWKHDAIYTCFFSQEARAISEAPAEPRRLQVRVLFGTGSESYRHGVCGAVESASQPTLLIVVSGIEPAHDITFWNPSNPGERRTLRANNRWGVGITTTAIERMIVDRYGRLINYDISVCAAFSTGYLGLQGSVNGRLFSLDRLERVVIYDCLYGSLRSALDRIKALKATAQIIAYVATEGGNSFRKGAPASLATLELGGIPTWHYVNLMGNVGFHAATSARLVSEARIPPARIVDPLPPAYDAALNELITKLPARNSMVSDDAVFRKVRGPIPGSATALATFAAAKANIAAIGGFFRQVSTTRHCIARAQLLGWPAPAGEEWHDMLLIEFAWEYLS